ncbi:hypothetical protein SFUMM280S_11395 [Streptomyces fumanus]
MTAGRGGTVEDRTRTLAPPGGDLIDIVVRDGCGAGRALAAGPTSPAATKAGGGARRPASSSRAQPSPRATGTSSVTAAAPRKLDLFARYANRYDRDRRFVLSVDKPGGDRYGPTGSSQPIRSWVCCTFRIGVGSSAWTGEASTNRYCWGGAAVAATWLSVGAGGAVGAAVEAPGGHGEDGTGRGRGETPQDVRREAARRADGLQLEKGKASIPARFIEVNEGDTLHIEFTNTMDVRASLHVHGLDYEISSDGTAMNKSDVEPGGTRTYTWRTHKPRTSQRRLAAGQRGLLALPRPRRRHRTRHRGHPQRPVRPGDRARRGTCCRTPRTQSSSTT